MDVLATTAAVWTRLPLELQRILKEVGGCEPHIFRSFFDGSQEEADCVVSQFYPGLELKAAEVVAAQLVELWKAAEVPARTAVRRTAAFSLEEAACAQVRAERMGRRRFLEEVLPLASSASSGAIAPGSRAVGYWPNRLKRDLALMDDPNARAAAEVRERTRWTVEAAAIVQEAQLPLAKIAELTMDPSATLARIAQGRRARSLRKRVSERTHGPSTADERINARAYKNRSPGKIWGEAQRPRQVHSARLADVGGHRVPLSQDRDREHRKLL